MAFVGVDVAVKHERSSCQSQSVFNVTLLKLSISPAGLLISHAFIKLLYPSGAGKRRMMMMMMMMGAPRYFGAGIHRG